MLKMFDRYGYNCIDSLQYNIKYWYIKFYQNILKEE